MTDEFVTVATCSQCFEAEIIRGRLESEGIEAHVQSGGWTDVYFGAGSNVGGGIAVQVPEADADRARGILEHPVDLPDDASWTPLCPACGSSEVSASAPPAGLLSIVMELLPRDGGPIPEIAYTCDRCGRQWTEQQTAPDPAVQTPPRLKDVHIRECAESDISAVRALQAEWTNEDITYGFTPAEESALREAIGPYFLVAERYGRIVGYITGAIRTTPGLAIVPEGQTFVEIDDIYVAPDHRDLGIGKELLTQVLARAKEQGATKALVYSATKDTRRIARFYERQGFEPWSIQMFKDLV
ncbi:MAG: GNAT family N-acetyltransferase [Candidatus Hydrogenedentes bacterium]|nr:GNAT family N-acetyltransferase [Candidatus Hydrogenedentota bacterium]